MFIDDWFATVSTNIEKLPDFDADKWSRTFGAHTYILPGDENVVDDDVPTKGITRKEEQA